MGVGVWDNEFGRVGWWVSVSVGVSLGGDACWMGVGVSVGALLGECGWA